MWIMHSEGWVWQWSLFLIVVSGLCAGMACHAQENAGGLGVRWRCPERFVEREKARRGGVRYCVAAEGRVLLADYRDGARMMCAGADDGSLRWRMSLGRTHRTPLRPFRPVVVRGVVIAFVRGHVMGLEVEKGHGLGEPFVLWRVPEFWSVRGALRLPGGLGHREGDPDWAVIWTSGDRLGALDYRTGRAIWELELSVRGRLEGALVEGADLLTKGYHPEADCDALVMVDLAARKEAWVCRFDGEVKGRGVTAFALAEAVVYCALTDGSVAVVERATGRQLKTLDAGLPASIGVDASVQRLALVEGVLTAVAYLAPEFDGEKGNKTLVVGLEPDTGRTIWRWQCEDAWLSDDAISDDGVWVLRRTSVSKVSAADGRARTLRLPEGLGSCSPAAWGAYLYCLDGNGYLICIEDKAARPAE